MLNFIGSNKMQNLIYFFNHLNRLASESYPEKILSKLIILVTNAEIAFVKLSRIVDYVYLT